MDSVVTGQNSDQYMKRHEDTGGGNWDSGGSSQIFESSSFDSSLPLIDINSQDIPSTSILLNRSNIQTNATLNSTGCKKTILIKPENLELIRNPVEIAIAVQKSITDQNKIKDVRTNRKLNIIAIEFKENEDHLIENLISTNKIGKWTASLKRPNTDTIKIGVISPVAIELDTDNIKQYIKSNGRTISNEVISVERMKKRTAKGWVNSQSVKISFKTTDLPKSLTILHSYYKVRPYVSEPLQCYKCQRLGHRADSCKGKTRCLLCGGEHNNKDCSTKKEEDFKCANCGGAHKANSRECKYIKSARKVEEVRAKENKTYSQAREVILATQSRKDFPQMNRHTFQAEVHLPMQSSQILKNSTWGGRKRTQQNTNSKDSSTQTMDSGIMNQEFFSKLKSCLCQILDSSVMRESKNVRELLVENALQKSFSQYNAIKNTKDKPAKRMLSDEGEVDFFDAIEEDDYEEGVISQDEMDDLSQNGLRRSQRLKTSSLGGASKKFRTMETKDKTSNNDSQ